MLFLFHEGVLAASYPVSVGRPNWPTSTGEFAVEDLRRHPTWHVPPSIQAEMRRNGERVVTRVDPGRNNPLGDYWIGLHGSGCGIHGTNAPTSIYGFRTHGCIRLHPEDIAALFPRVRIGTPVRVAYEPVLLTGTADGAVFLEVNPDPYRRSQDPANAVQELAALSRLDRDLDWPLVEDVIRRHEGLARRVDRGADTHRSGQAFAPGGHDPLARRSAL